MRRGDVVLVREPGSPASKARPCIVVQRESALAVADKATVCPLTSKLRGSAGERPFVAPTAQNGLRAPSEVQVDWIFTHRMDNMGEVIGKLDEPTMALIDTALRRWLDL
jgi:mRNA interferase MazF